MTVVANAEFAQSYSIHPKISLRLLRGKSVLITGKCSLFETRIVNAHDSPQSKFVLERSAILPCSYSCGSWFAQKPDRKAGKCNKSFDATHFSGRLFFRGSSCEFVVPVFLLENLEPRTHTKRPVSLKNQSLELTRRRLRSPIS